MTVGFGFSHIRFREFKSKQRDVLLGKGDYSQGVDQLKGKERA